MPADARISNQQLRDALHRRGAGHWMNDPFSIDQAALTRMAAAALDALDAAAEQAATWIAAGFRADGQLTLGSPQRELDDQGPALTRAMNEIAQRVGGYGFCVVSRAATSDGLLGRRHVSVYPQPNNPQGVLFQIMSAVATAPGPAGRALQGVSYDFSQLRPAP